MLGAVPGEPAIGRGPAQTCAYSDPRQDGARAPGVREFQCPGSPSSRLPDRAADARAHLPHSLSSCGILACTASGRHRSGRPTTDVATIRSHDQFNTTIYSNDDRYRGLKGTRTVIFMNEDDMSERGIEEFALVDIKSFSKDGTERSVYGYRAIRYEIPSGCAVGYMPELNVLCGIADFSTQSEQPVMKHIIVEVTPARLEGQANSPSGHG